MVTELSLLPIKNTLDWNRIFSELLDYELLQYLIFFNGLPYSLLDLVMQEQKRTHIFSTS